MLAKRGSLVVKHCLLLIMTDICCFASQKWKEQGERKISHTRLPELFFFFSK